jgi:Xaa-Pro aminopeptidase
MGDLLLTELQRRKAGKALVEVLEGFHQLPGDAMSEEEIAAEIKSARRERRARETGR